MAALPADYLRKVKADTSASQLYYFPETTWGEPVSATNVYKEIRYTGETLAHAKNTVQSQEIRSDAQITDLIEVGVSGEGNINIELSYGAHDDFLAALLRTAWVPYSGGAAQVLTFAGTGLGPFTIAGTFPTPTNLVAGLVIRVSGAGANSGFYTVISATGSLITTQEASTTPGASPATGKIDTEYIRNGKVKKSFLLERQFTDLMPPAVPASPPLSAVHYMRGARINTMTLNFTADAILTGTFGVMGDQMTVVDATSGHPSQTTPAPTNDVMNATSNVGAIYEGAALLNNAIQSLTLEVTNNCRSQRSIGSRSAVGIGYGRFVVSGTMNMYFENGDVFEKMINHTASSWATVVSDTPSAPTTGHSYAFNVFKLKFASGGPQAGAPDTDVMQNLAYTAMRDPVTKVTLQICRFPVPIP